MFYEIDENAKFEYRFVLCLPNQTEIGYLENEYVVRAQLSAEFPTTNELDLEIVEDSQLFDDIKGDYLIKVEKWQNDSIQDEQYYIIASMQKESSGKELKKTIKGYSAEYELNNKMIRGYERISRSLWEVDDLGNPVYDDDGNYRGVLNYLNTKTTWSFEVGEEFQGNNADYRAFEISQKTLFAFLTEDISEAFDCVFYFDTKNKTIVPKKIEDVGEDKGFYISDRNFIESLTVEDDFSEIATRIYGFGSDGITIHAANPTRAGYVENFDYYEQNYMSQELKNKLASLRQKRIDSKDQIDELNEDLDKAIKESDEIYSILHIGYEDENEEWVEPLYTQLRLLKDERDVLINANEANEDNQEYTDLLDDIDELQAKIDDKEDLLEDKDAEVDSIRKAINDLHDTFSPEHESNNFTSENLRELDYYTREKVYSNNAYTSSEELYEKTLKVAEKSAYPPIEISLNLIDFLTVLEFQDDWEKLQLGDRVTLSTTKFGFDAFLRIVGYNHDILSQSLSVDLSNKSHLDDPTIEFSDFISRAASTRTTVDLSKYKWDKGPENEAAIEEIRNQELDASRNKILAGANQNITMDETGLTLANKEKPGEEIRAINNTIAFTKDNWKNASLAITPDGLYAPAVYGTLLAGGNLIIESENGNMRIGDKVQVAKVDENGDIVYDSETGDVIYQDLNTQLTVLDGEIKAVVGELETEVIRQMPHSISLSNTAKTFSVNSGMLTEKNVEISTSISTFKGVSYTEGVLSNVKILDEDGNEIVGKGELTYESPNSSNGYTGYVKWSVPINTMIPWSFGSVAFQVTIDAGKEEEKTHFRQITWSRAMSGEKGDSGESAPLLKTRYSANEGGPWQEVFEEGMEWMQTSNDGGETWSSSIRIVGRDAKFLEYRFKRAPEKPDTPVGKEPEEWSDTPATGPVSIGDILWTTSAYKDSSTGALLTDWSEPSQISGDSIITEYSPDGESDWSSNFRSSIDRYMRQKKSIFGEWGPPIRIVGEDGKYTEHRFAKNNSLTLPPDKYNPEIWTEGPPSLEENEYLWMKARDIGYDGHEPAWHDPVRISGPKGEAAPLLLVMYSPDGESDWSTSVRDTDLYIRTSNDGGESWSDPSRFVGESGSYVEYQFGKSITTSEPPEENNANWHDQPPSVSEGEYLWMRKRTVDPMSGAEDWSTPVRISGDKGERGDDAPTVMIEYSESKEGPWFNTFEEGHKYMTISRDGGITWGDPIKITGDDGKYQEYQFASNMSLLDPPQSGWQDSPPSVEEAQVLWMRTRVFDPSDPLEEDEGWTDPVRISGQKGSDAKLVNIIADSAYFIRKRDIEDIKDDPENEDFEITPDYITLTGFAQNVEFKENPWEYSLGGGAWEELTDSVNGISVTTDGDVTILQIQKNWPLLEDLNNKYFVIRLSAEGGYSSAQTIKISADDIDLDQRLRQAQFVINQESIQMIITDGGDGVASLINLDGTTAKIKASKIELTGAITVEDFSPELEQSLAKEESIQKIVNGEYEEGTFISGKVIQSPTILNNKAGMTDDGGPLDDAVRIWAGSNFANRDNAPFRVKQDGTTSMGSNEHTPKESNNTFNHDFVGVYIPSQLNNSPWDGIINRGGPSDSRAARWKYSNSTYLYQDNSSFIVYFEDTEPDQHGRRQRFRVNNQGDIVIPGTLEAKNIKIDGMVVSQEGSTVFADQDDDSKQMRFDLSNISSNTIRMLEVPNESGIIALQNGDYSSLRARATTKSDVGLSDVDNYSRSHYDDRYSFSGHTHDANDIDSGTISISRLPSEALIGDTTYSAGSGLLLSNEEFVLATPSTITNFTANSVSSDSHTHELVVTADDIGLGNVDNYSRDHYDNRYAPIEHISNDGSDHTWINQDVRTSANVEFNKILVSDLGNGSSSGFILKRTDSSHDSEWYIHGGYKEFTIDSAARDSRTTFGIDYETGNISIGGAPSSYKLQVEGDIKAHKSLIGTDRDYANITVQSGDIDSASRTNEYPIVITNEDSIEEKEGAGIAFHVSGSSNLSTPGAAITHKRTGGWSSGELSFWTKQSGSQTGAIDKRMTITSHGNVGINSSAPEEKLEIGGSVKANGFKTGAFAIEYNEETECLEFNLI